MSQIIAISGSTGLIGRRLISHYQGLGWEVIPLKRGDFSMDSVSLAARLKGAHAVVNLAGAPIAQRWTLKGRKVIMDSRINTTRSLVEAIGKMSEPPSVLLNASAIGIYPDTGDHTEDSLGRDHSFMGQVCEAWEREAEVVRDGTRLVLLRFGVVLDAGGGALARLLPFFRMGVGGRVGSGDQAFSWIHSTDLVRGISFLHLESKVNGPVNMVAPLPSTNKEFTASLAKILRRPAIIPIPSFALRLFMGEAADILLKGQSVLPQKLQDNGFVYDYPDLEEALKSLA